MKHKLISLIAGLALVLSFAGVASAHTGSISAVTSQECGVQTTVSAHLDDNVAASATYSLVINGGPPITGTGPGPKDLGPYSVGFAAGSATLTITFGEESNPYTVNFGASKGACATPTPRPTPSIPVKTPKPSIPNITPPPTSTAPADGTSLTPYNWAFLLGGAGFLIVVLLLTTRDMRRRS
jgi:hypothetical protein